ncbi:hypothetical protein CGCF413_v001512 [Colletotrichum fructicola]|nr:hypothetical protein CGCF413_v001512 [Colletotrichum fructicola]
MIPDLEKERKSRGSGRGKAPARRSIPGWRERTGFGPSITFLSSTRIPSRLALSIPHVLCAGDELLAICNFSEAPSQDAGDAFDSPASMNICRWPRLRAPPSSGLGQSQFPEKVMLAPETTPRSARVPFSVRSGTTTNVDSGVRVAKPQ